MSETKSAFSWQETNIDIKLKRLSEKFLVELRVESVRGAGKKILKRIDARNFGRDVSVCLYACMYVRTDWEIWSGDSAWVTLH